jgi:hypothetical protein
MMMMVMVNSMLMTPAMMVATFDEFFAIDVRDIHRQICSCSYQIWFKEKKSIKGKNHATIAGM